MSYQSVSRPPAGGSPLVGGASNGARADASGLAAALFGPASPQRPARKAPRPPSVKRSAAQLGVALVVALAVGAVLNAFVVESFVIPSSSMAPTLQPGDRVVVNRVAAHVGVHRGDVVVFDDPGGWLDGASDTDATSPVGSLLTAVRLNPLRGHYLVKRVVGVGGDLVAVSDTGQVVVNGTPLAEGYTTGLGSSTPFEVRVPDGCLWVMGDNRAGSADSRAHVADARHGCVPRSSVVGVVQAIVEPGARATLLRNPGLVFADVPAAPAP